MEVEKRKNKRVIREEKEEEKLKKLKGENEQQQLEEEEEDDDDNDSGVPTEEEVEEFFAILRRMRVAVKYFDDKGKGGGREWREALETAEVAVDHGRDVVAAGDDDDHKDKQKGSEGIIINEGFDLNAVAPEAAEGGGA